MTFASSLPVPSVQELVKERPMVAVPERYVRPELDPPILPANPSLPMIPIIDMQSLVIGESMDLELERLHATCRDWGVFQLVNHGVSSSLVEKLKSEINEFFKSPLEEKMRYRVRQGSFEGFGQSQVLSEDQKLDWGDRFSIITNPVDVRKPYLLPELSPRLRDALESYCSELQKLAMALLGLMSRALNMEIEEMKELFDDGMHTVRMNYYPPCPRPELVIGLTPHSDSAGITFLLHANEVEGLQIRKDGTWIPVKPLPNAFVVNVGDILEIVSNGAYRSIEHRAVVNSMKERISIAMFFNPKLDGEIGPATSLLNNQNPPLFKRVSVWNYFEDFFSRKLDGKSHLEHMRIKEEGDTT